MYKVCRIKRVEKREKIKKCGDYLHRGWHPDMYFIFWFSLTDWMMPNIYNYCDITNCQIFRKWLCQMILIQIFRVKVIPININTSA